MSSRRPLLPVVADDEAPVDPPAQGQSSRAEAVAVAVARPGVFFMGSPVGMAAMRTGSRWCSWRGIFSWVPPAYAVGEWSDDAELVPEDEHGGTAQHDVFGVARDPDAQP